MNRQRTLILTSTLPRWKNDHTPSFVLDFAKQIAKAPNTSVLLLAPHYAKTKTRDTVNNNVKIKRFRYFIPNGENIAYEGGGVGKVNRNPLYLLKLFLYCCSLYMNTIWYGLNKNTVINAHWLIPQGFIAVTSKPFHRKKVITTVHGSDIFALNGRFFRALKLIVLKLSDEVVVNSSATKNACKKIYDRAYHIIPMGVDNFAFQPADKKVSLYGMTNKIFTVLFVGRLTSEKGVMLCMESMNALNKKGLNFQCIVAGEGPLRDKVEKYVQKNSLKDNVKLVGWLNKPELVELYQFSDVVVGPSEREAFGLTFLEAQLCGKPVIASNVGGIQDIVKNNLTGFLLETPYEAEEISNKIELLMNSPDLLSTMSKAAAKNARNKFSWNEVSRKYRKILEFKEA